MSNTVFISVQTKFFILPIVSFRCIFSVFSQRTEKSSCLVCLFVCLLKKKKKSLHTLCSSTRPWLKESCKALQRRCRFMPAFAAALQKRSSILQAAAGLPCKDSLICSRTLIPWLPQYLPALYTNPQNEVYTAGEWNSAMLTVILVPSQAWTGQF